MIRHYEEEGMIEHFKGSTRSNGTSNGTTVAVAVVAGATAGAVTADANSNTTKPPAPAPAPAQTNNNKLSDGAIAGIVVGVVLFVAIAIILYFKGRKIVQAASSISSSVISKIKLPSISKTKT